MIDFPSCVIGEQPEMTGESLEIGDQPYCWRNLFASINLLRMLNKLCKWKHSRIMVRRAPRLRPQRDAGGRAGGEGTGHSTAVFHWNDARWKHVILLYQQRRQHGILGPWAAL